jgi:hypothetical protein
MTKSAIAAAALLAACNTMPPEVLPPPFGPNGRQDPRLFFPTGLAAAPDGTLLVANGNFNHAYNSGTILTLSRTFLDSLFQPSVGLPLDCDVPNPDPGCLVPVPADAAAALIGNYAGPLALSDDGTIALTGSRDSGNVNAVQLQLNSGGLLHCLPGTGNDATQDCRKGLLNLTANGVDGPYAIVPGTAVVQSSGGPPARPVFFVSSVIPHIDQISSGILYTSTAVAAIDMQAPWELLFTMRAGSRFVGGGYGVGPMVFDPVRRQLYLGGCYFRSSAFGAGEPGSALCNGVTTNYLRILNVDVADAADPVLFDLHTDVLSIDTVQFLLGDPDPGTGAPTALWATMRNPDTLVRIELPAQPSIAPRVRKVIPMPASPADMVRIARPGASDLIAVVTEKTNGVAIVDTASGEVVSQIGRLGNSPFMIREVSCPASITGSACLATSVFAECRVALIEVPKSQPALAKLRALIGKCP